MSRDIMTVNIVLQKYYVTHVKVVWVDSDMIEVSKYWLITKKSFEIILILRVPCRNSTTFRLRYQWSISRYWGRVFGNIIYVPFQNIWLFSKVFQNVVWHLDSDTWEIFYKHDMTFILIESKWSKYTSKQCLQTFVWIAKGVPCHTHLWNRVLHNTLITKEAGQPSSNYSYESYWTCDIIE